MCPECERLREREFIRQERRQGDLIEEIRLELTGCAYCYMSIIRRGTKCLSPHSSFVISSVSGKVYMALPDFAGGDFWEHPHRLPLPRMELDLHSCSLGRAFLCSHSSCVAAKATANNMSEYGRINAALLSTFWTLANTCS